MEPLDVDSCIAVDLVGLPVGEVPFQVTIVPDELSHLERARDDGLVALLPAKLIWLPGVEDMSLLVLDGRGQLGGGLEFAQIVPDANEVVVGDAPRSAAASHDILEFKRCSCNVLKPKAILGSPNPPPTAFR